MKEKQSDWEKEFDEKLSRTQEPVYNKKVKSFISNLLLQQKQELIKKIKKIATTPHELGLSYGDYTEIYDKKSVDNIISSLDTKEEENE